jgi:hypothetical protein
MTSVRRWYIFLVCAVSLQSVTWAAINLLRNLFTRQYSASAMALPIAVIVIGLPVFLAHWLWAQSLARRDPEEQASPLRCLYLYGMLSGFLAPFLVSAFSLVNVLFLMLLGIGGPSFAYGPYSEHDTLLRSLAALAVLAVMWSYHLYQVRADSRLNPVKGNRAVINRLYVLSFSGVGLTLLVLGMIHLVRYVLYRFSPAIIASEIDPAVLAADLTRLIIGVLCWVPFWRQAQNLFASSSHEEKESALRKFYLYSAVFAGVLGTVANTTVILASLFRRILAIPAQGDIRQPLPIIIGMAILWATHSTFLQRDTRQGAEAPRQEGIHRLYLYIVAGVGLAAFLIGLGGLVSILIRTRAGAGFNLDLRSQLAWFLSALLAGLPVWIIPWRTVQGLALQSDLPANEARRSVVRKIYLYFFLFAATMTVLAGAVYIIDRMVSPFFGEASPTLSDLGQAIAFTLIALGVWVYHGATLRRDGSLTRQMQARRNADLHVVLINTVGIPFGEDFTRALQRELLGLSLNTLIAQEPEDREAEQLIKDCLDQAGLIISPWAETVPSLAVGPLFAAALSASPGRKLLLPISLPGWDWAGVDNPNPESLLEHAAYTARLIATGQELRPQRPMGSATIIAIVAGVFILMILAIILAANFFSFR